MHGSLVSATFRKTLTFSLPELQRSRAVALINTDLSHILDNMERVQDAVASPMEIAMVLFSLNYYAGAQTLLVLIPTFGTFLGGSMASLFTK